MTQATPHSPAPLPPPAPPPPPGTSAPVVRAFAGIGIVVLGVWGLYHAGSVIVPVVQAVVVWMVLNAFANWLRRLPRIGRRLPGWGALSIASLAALVACAIMVRIALSSVAQVTAEAYAFQTLLTPLLERLALRFGVEDAAGLQGLFSGVRLDAVARMVVSATTTTISQFSIVVVYVGFMLVDQQFLPAKLAFLFPDPARRAEAQALIRRLALAIYGYLQVMTFASVLTSAVIYLILRLVGMETAGFWATAIFFLNFIPTIGSILGTVLPVAFVLVEVQSFGAVLVALVGVGMTQFVVGNILVPRLFGDRLNVSLFVVLLSIFSFGALWGLTGMFVAMPVTAMLIIAFGHFEATRPIAILLSRNGDVSEPGPPPDKP